MITGTHMLFYTSEPEKLRAMLRDVFGFKHVDAGGGWWIFALPPSEIGVRPGEGPDGEPKDQGYGIVTTLKLPGGCDVQLYEPRHAIAAGMAPNVDLRPWLALRSTTADWKGDPLAPAVDYRPRRRLQHSCSIRRRMRSNAPMSCAARPSTSDDLARPM